MKIHFHLAETEKAQEAYKKLSSLYGDCELAEADFIVALGGDGSMLRALHESMKYHKPVYGMNMGSLGFLLNEYREENLPERLKKAQTVIVNPLKMKVENEAGEVFEHYGINEISMLRETRQAAKLKIIIDGKVRLEELTCDGIIVATPAGSTAYNYSVHGPIIPLDAGLLALSPISAFRPRRWRGALLSQSTEIKIDVLESDKRPVSAVADFYEIRDAKKIEVRSVKDIQLRLLFDPEMNLEERIIKEQFIN